MTEHRYHHWAGNPQGVRENVTHCVEEVSDQDGRHAHQCMRKRGKGKDGLYCAQHAKWHPAGMTHENCPDNGPCLFEANTGHTTEFSPKAPWGQGRRR